MLREARKVSASVSWGSIAAGAAAAAALLVGAVLSWLLGEELGADRPRGDEGVESVAATTWLVEGSSGMPTSASDSKSEAARAVLAALIAVQRSSAAAFRLLMPLPRCLVPRFVFPSGVRVACLLIAGEVEVQMAQRQTAMAGR